MTNQELKIDIPKKEGSTRYCQFNNQSIEWENRKSIEISTDKRSYLISLTDKSAFWKCAELKLLCDEIKSE